MPFFVTRRIIEGLGLGLARRAARKLVPVVLTLGSGPSSFPRKISRRRLKLPRQPGRGASRARFRNFGAGSLPVGLPEKIFRATAEASATAVAPAPSLARALSFWRWGLARRASRNNFPGDGQSFCDSLPRARFRRFGAWGWPDGLPETSFRAMQSGGILDGQWPQWPFYQPEANFIKAGQPQWPFCQASEGRVACACFRNFGFPKQVSGRRPKLPRQPWQARAVARARSVVLALGAGPSGFPKQFSGRRPKLLRQPPSRSLPFFWRWGVAGRGVPETSDESGGILDGQWPQWPFYQPEADKWPDL